jgi:ribosome biogenesis GTPase
VTTDLIPWGLEHHPDLSGETLAPDGDLGRVVRVDRGECDVVTRAGPVRVFSDSQRAQDELAPVTGDWVEIGHEEGLGPVVRRILPRRTSVRRRDPAERDLEQVLAANADVIAVVHGLDRPLPPGRLERLLVVAHTSGADPLVVLTKADVAPPGDDTEAVVRAVAGRVGAEGIDVVVTSVEDGTGLDALRDRLGRGRTLALIGPSGVGKSALVNALVGTEVLETGEVRATDAKGRHTTTARELVLLPGDGGLVLDTPGIRAVGLWEAEDALDLVFGDLEELADTCRFGDCAHRAEPGCAIRAAVDEDGLDGRRVDRYLALVAELAAQRAREEERARGEQRGREPRRRNRRGRRRR